MKLLALLHRRTKTVPLLPADENRDAAQPPGRPRRTRPNGQLEERLERLLTPNELDIVQHHRI
ncbi:hypothetical protein [Nocardia sp. NBC_01327]|uniref:hypothetical protein n=1 Tax=Nocardia sp. NBC_01327 TaxID=2903593 RepID=UPI002E14ECBA|nr:hypothetical protein OG326_00080 [Nocardia sp. NBC_01327]